MLRRVVERNAPRYQYQYCADASRSGTFCVNVHLSESDIYYATIIIRQNADTPECADSWHTYWTAIDAAGICRALTLLLPEGSNIGMISSAASQGASINVFVRADAIMELAT